MNHALASRRLSPSLIVLLAGGLVWSGCSDGPDSIIGPAGARNSASVSASGTAGQQLAQDVQEALRAKRRHAPGLLRIEGILGAGVGLDEEGEAVVKLFTAKPGIQGIPDRLDGVPVEVQVTGLFMARPAVRPTPVVAAADAAAIAPAPALTVLLANAHVAAEEPNSTADRWPRPVPPGVSTGHPDITAGTLGARVKDGSGDLYALSNNHVYGNSNDATVGDPIIQPGTFDGGQSPADDIGTLAGYVPIDFSGGSNLMDAAIAGTTDALVGASTPTSFGAYGAPSAEIWGDGNDDGVFDDKTALLGLQVEKFGRTTGPTHGTVDAIDVTVNVCYEALLGILCVKSALFVDQIAIVSNDTNPFSAGGDSGSLIVSDAGHQPVGLLFAGNNTSTLANRIDLVLNEFGVTVDDGSGGTGGGTNSPPTAEFTSSCTDLTCDFTDASTDSDGTIASWSWVFGDGGSSTAQNPSHTYAAGGTYTVTLTATDDDGDSHAVSHDVTVTEPASNSPPTAEFTSSCTDLTCDFTDASTDSDGTIASWSWVFGDGGSSTAQNPSHTYAAGGTYTVTLTATDDDGDSHAVSHDVTVTEPSSPGTIHAGDLDATSNKLSRGQWEATVTVRAHDGAHGIVSGATVTGSFEQNGTLMPRWCVTDGSGACLVESGPFPDKSGKARFVVSSVSASDGSLTYTPDDNHDPDGDSDGTIIELSK